MEGFIILFSIFVIIALTLSVPNSLDGSIKKQNKTNKSENTENTKRFLNQYFISISNKELTHSMNYNTNNPFQHVDMVYYINMDKNKCRNTETLLELTSLGMPAHKITRISGVVDKFGALGCSKSHLQALTDCKSKGYNRCIIFEDDIVFKYGKEFTYSQLNRLFDLNVRWDVVMLASHTLEYEQTNFDFLLKIIKGQTTAGYMVNKHFIDKMIDNLTFSVNELEKHDKSVHDYCIDVYWNKLQEQHTWYTFTPVMCHQRDSFSDIEGRMVSYNDKYEVKTVEKFYNYIILVKTCKPYHKKNAKLDESLRSICNTHKDVIFYYYYGDPELKQDFEIREKDRIITLKCKDDYLNLAWKIGSVFRTIVSLQRNNKYMEQLMGVFFMDDDIEIKDEAAFYNTIQKNQQESYWGNTCNSKSYTSNHIKQKYNESNTVKTMVDTLYPDLLNYRILKPSVLYCSGGGFYLRLDSIVMLSNELELFSPFPNTQEELYCYFDEKLKYYNVKSAFDDVNIALGLKNHGIIPKHVDVLKYLKW